MPNISPYLNFNGNAEEAFNFYKSVFGTEFSDLRRFNSIPAGESMKLDASEGNKIMHIALPVGNTFLLGSDVPVAYQKVTSGSNFSVTVHADSEAEGRKIFDALAPGGKTGMPWNKAFWGAYFGMVTDKFGISWSINYQVA